jgi:NAD(P)-dependent dehydrogenase (short-subunit alcohol dehydrogenase family)
VTGGASGVGEAITRSLAADAKNRIYFTFNRSGDKAKAIENEFPSAKGIHCDFTDEVGFNRFIELIPSFEIDVLVNNAITGIRKQHFHKIKADEFLDSFTVNVIPVIRITQACLLGFRKRKSGKVITILTSYLVNRPPKGLSEYVANKAYLRSLCKSWAGENAHFNISSNSVSPSMMLTQLTSDTDERVLEQIIEAHPLKRLVTPIEVAEAVRFLIQASAHINGVDLLMNGGSDVV